MSALGAPPMLSHHGPRVRCRRGMTTIVAVFLSLVLAMLCLLLGAMVSSGGEEARAFLRSKQAFYVSDAGLWIGKQLVTDNGNDWRPWNGSGYDCPSGWTGVAQDSDTHYCAGTMTVGNVTATIRVYICKDGTTTGNNADPCEDADTNDDFELLGFGTLSGA